MKEKLTKFTKRITSRVLPVGSRRRQIAKAVVKKRRPQTPMNITYAEWIKRIEPLTVSASSSIRSHGPSISLVVPCYNTPPRYIQELVESVVAQTYQNWQLCLADSSYDSRSSDAILAAATQDPRIIYTPLKKNFGISGNTNKAIEKATGDYIGFLDHDDVLPPWALAEVIQAIQANPKAGVFYSDEDRLSEDGKTRMTPLFKCDWSPDLFLCVNYVAHFLVMKRQLLLKLGGLRPEYDGSQDYDLMLRALDHHPEIIHIPKVLYHMRQAASSTASQISVKDYTHDAGKRALDAYFKRNKISAKTLPIENRPTNHHIKYGLAKKTTRQHYYSLQR